MSRRPDDVERARSTLPTAPASCSPRRSCGATTRRRAGWSSCASEIGELRLIRASFSFLLERPGDLRLQAALDGGALMDVGCYCVSAAQAARRRAAPCQRPAGAGRRRRRRAPHRAAALRGRRARDDRLRPRHGGARRARGDGHARACCWLDDPWHSRSARDRAAPCRRLGRAHRRRAARTRTPASSKISPRPSPASARRATVARTRVGQARAIAGALCERRSQRTDGGTTMKTSLGIWAFGPMITRFVPGGYQPAHAYDAEPVAEKVHRAVEGLGELIDGYEFHYPQELSHENLSDVAGGARRARHLLHRRRPAPRPALRARRPRQSRRAPARRGADGSCARARSSPARSART